MPKLVSKSSPSGLPKATGYCSTRWLVVCLLSLLLSTPCFGQNGYSFTLAGAPFTPEIEAVVGSEGAPQEGDLAHINGFWLVLGPPGSYKIDGDRERVFASVDGQPRQLVAARISQESNPLARLSIAQLNDLRSVEVYDWRPEMTSLLPQLPAHCYIKLRSYYDRKTQVRMEKLPPLPPITRYLEIKENSNFGYTDFSGLAHLPELRYLRLESMTLEKIDAGWLSEGLELRVLEVSSKNELDHPESLKLPSLRRLSARFEPSVRDLAWIGNLPALQVLDVSASQGLEDFTGLEGHPSLRVVEAAECPVKHLPKTKVPALQRLSTLGAAVSPEAAKAFSAVNPGTLHYSYIDELKKSLATANRVRVRTGGTCHRMPSEEETLFEVADAPAIAALLDTVEIDDTRSGFQCMCCGEPTLEFYDEKTLLASVGFHHGQFLRWSDGWPGDGFLTDRGAEALGDWMAANGLPGPKLAGEATRQQMRQGQRAWEEATASLPGPIKTALAGIGYDSSPGHSKLSAALKAAYPAPDEQILILYRVIGRSGPWNPFKSFEGHADEELETYPPETLRVALDTAMAGSDSREKLGAARFWSTNRTAADWDLTGPQVDRVLEVLLASPSAWTRQLGVWRVRSWSGRGIDAGGHLAVAISDPEPDVRRAAIFCTGLVGLETLAPELLKVLAGQAGEPRAPFPNPPEDDSTVLVGGETSESDLAALSLGLMKHQPAVELLLAQPPSASREVALALLGRPELLRQEHFMQPDGNTELQLAAVLAVARCKGSYGLSWALEYDSEQDLSGSRNALEILKQMLTEQGAPGLKELEACEELKDLKAWYQRHGETYLRQARSKKGALVSPSPLVKGRLSRGTLDSAGGRFGTIKVDSHGSNQVLFG